MPPRDIRSLLELLTKRGDFTKVITNPITQWGPADRRMLSADLLPPRVVDLNQNTIEEVHFRAVAAQDGTRYSPAQLVDSGEIWGKINYRLGHSDLARQITGPDYDGIQRSIAAGRGLSMEGAGRLLGLFQTYMVQGMVEHDELVNWEAIVFNQITRRGNNAYFDYENGPNLSGHRVTVGGDWQDPEYDPYKEDIIPRIRFLKALGYETSGIRIYTSDAVLQVLADHPATTRRAFTAQIGTGQTLEELVGATTDDDVARVFRKLKVQAPIANDLRIHTKTGEKRVYPEDHMTFVASTGRSEQVIYNVGNKANVKVVRNTLGFSGIGTPNGKLTAQRAYAVRGYTDQKDARVEMEGWQATGPVILEPTAITDIADINI